MTGGSIELSGLTKRFGEIAVDSIDLTVASSEFFSLLAGLLAVIRTGLPPAGDELTNANNHEPLRHVATPVLLGARRVGGWRMSLEL
ncbi:MAG TPA: hypothetical protein VIY52_24010 [Streptosporangiaceae bacterium]